MAGTRTNLSMEAQLKDIIRRLDTLESRKNVKPGAATVQGLYQLLITSGADVSATSTSATNPLQIGADGGPNVAYDNNEIMARDGLGDPAHLYINTNGGAVTLGDVTSLISIPGHINSPFSTYAIAAGTSGAFGSIASAATASVTITLPTSRFSVAPVVFATGLNSRMTMSVSGVSATSFTLTCANWSTGTLASGATANWVAIQMTASSAGG